MAELKGLSKADLLAAVSATNLPIERVDVPEFGGFVYVRGMTGRERDAFERSNLMMKRGQLQANMDNLGNARARLAVRCICDEHGARLFGDDDADALGGLRADVLSRLYAIAQRLSNVTNEDLEELKKYSGSVAGTASSST